MQLKSLLFSFHGRIHRLPYWVVTLLIIGWGATFQQLMGPYGEDNPMQIGAAVVTIINFILVLWIGAAVQVKRWHDRDKSTKWLLINLIPIIGQVWVLVECGILPGTVGDNRFGHDSTSP